MAVQSVKELIVYKKAYQQAMSFFELSGQFPSEEKYLELTKLNRETAKMLGSMLKSPEKFLLTPDS